MKAESRKVGVDGLGIECAQQVHISTFNLDGNANFMAALTLEFLDSERYVGKSFDVFTISWPIQRRCDPVLHSYFDC